MSWRYASASVTGTSHLKSGVVCQDNSRCGAIININDESVFLAIVSDGAGSARMSDVGSRTLCDTVFEAAHSYLTDGNDLMSINESVVTEWLTLARSEMIAKTDGASIRDYACTFLLAMVGEVSSVFAQIGDGAIVFHKQNDSWEYPFWPQKGEYANITHFVTEDGFEANLMFKTIDDHPINTVAIFSDGLENLALHMASRTVFPGFFKEMVRLLGESDVIGEDAVFSEQLSRYLSSKAICDRTDDDKSLILAVRHIGCYKDTAIR